MVQPDPGRDAMFTVFVPNNAAFKAYETFDPQAYSKLISDYGVWHQVRPTTLHAPPPHGPIRSHVGRWGSPDGASCEASAACASSVTVAGFTHAALRNAHLEDPPPQHHGMGLGVAAMHVLEYCGPAGSVPVGMRSSATL